MFKLLTSVLLASCFLITKSSLFDGYDFMGSTNAIGDLRNKLLENYHPKARPVRNHYHNTTVELGLSVTFLDLDDYDQTLTVTCFLLVTWTDEFLSWDPKLNDNVTTLHFDREEIWMPDIALYNSASNADATPKSNLPLLVYENGKVYWAPHFTAKVPCLLDISTWPSDKHTCSLRFGSWAHHGEQIDLIISPQENAGIKFEYYQNNDRWKIISFNGTKLYSSYDEVTYQYILYQVSIARLAASHAIYISQTTLTVIVVLLSSYFLPLEFHLSRILLHLFSLTALVGCNIIMFVTLPATSGHVPFVVKYYSGALILTTLSMLCQVVMANTITYTTESSFGIRGFFRALIGFPQHSYTARNNASEEISYTNLEEEVRESLESDPPEENRRTSNTPTTTNHSSIVVNSTHIHDIHRVINIVLFCMFTVAYVVDYGILRSSIGY